MKEVCMTFGATCTLLFLAKKSKFGKLCYYWVKTSTKHHRKQTWLTSSKCLHTFQTFFPLIITSILSLPSVWKLQFKILNCSDTLFHKIQLSWFFFCLRSSSFEKCLCIYIYGRIAQITLPSAITNHMHFNLFFSIWHPIYILPLACASRISLPSNQIW